ncbi:MAG: hypothetical protein GX073_06160 [Firmicutes bacterium]|nr:hypothetical protein [Bacillota bacterium]
MFVERMRVYFGTADLMIYPTQDSPSSFFYANRAEAFADELEYIVGSIQTSGRLVLKLEAPEITLKGFTLPELQKLNPFYLTAQDKLHPFQGRKIILSKQTAAELGLKLGDYLDIEVLGAKTEVFNCGLGRTGRPFPTRRPKHQRHCPP